MQQTSHTNLWAEYFKEREGFDTISDEHCVATYRISGEECYIKDIFVAKDKRRSGLAFDMGDRIAKIAKGKGCTYLTGSVVPSLPGSTGTLSGLLAFGFSLKESHNDFIILIKEI